MNFEMFLILFFIFWLLVFNKRILFWVWLWQLKEYHLGRFKAHFQTYKGKKLIFNKLLFFKIFLSISFIIAPYFFTFPGFEFDPIYQTSVIFLFSLLFLLYFGEGIKAIFDIYKKRLRIPVLTKKTLLILGIFLLIQILSLPYILKYFFFTFLILDITSPLIATFFVALVHPLAIFWRWQIINKAKEKREKFKDLIVIGITGSFGKTSTKEFLAEILSKKYNVLKTPGHWNSEVGISKCILNHLKPEHQIFVVEMGAYNKGGIRLLCDITKPKIGILCGANEQHLATFGTMENLLSAEGGKELVESLPEDGLAIFNGSNPYTFKLYLKTKKPKKVYRYQAIADTVEPDIFAKDIVMSKNSIGFRVYIKGETPLDLKINVLGTHNVGNILAAILVAQKLGMNLEEIVKGCEKIGPKKGGMKILKGINETDIIDSTYSANPDGVMAHLDYLRIWPSVAKKIIVTPCLIELGKASKEIHKKIGEKIGKVCDLAIITSRDFFAEIEKAAILAGLSEENILFIENPKEIFERIKIFSGPGDTILLEGRVPKQLINLLTK